MKEAKDKYDEMTAREFAIELRNLRIDKVLLKIIEVAGI